MNYAKEYLGQASDGMILLFSAGNLAAAMAAGWIAGRWLDRTGSRPVLRCASFAFAAIAAAWLAGALGKAHFGYGEIALLFAAQGMAGTFLGIAQTRLLIAACPAPLKTEGLTLYQVCCALAGGLSPLAWGFVLKALPGDLGARYSIFFLTTGAMMLLGQLLVNNIRESAAMRTRELLGLIIFEAPVQVVADIAALIWRPFSSDHDDEAGDSGGKHP